MRFLDQLDISGKKLLIRVDYNVPLKDGVITDDIRIRESLPTLRYALDKGAALVLIAHLGKPKGQKVPQYSLAPVAAHLGKLLGMDIPLAPDCVGPEAEKMAAELAPGKVLLMENLRYHAGEEKNDPEFSAKLAKLGEIYVDDAFGTAHRAHASNVGVTKHMKACCAGFLLQKEWKFLGESLADPARPYVAISGGAKVSTKLGILKNLLAKVDALIIGGAMANTFLLAQGHSVGKSLVEPDLVDAAREVVEMAKAKGVTLALPEDYVVGPSLDVQTSTGIYDGANIPADAMILDVGPRSVEKFAQVLAGAKTVMWNGPMGAFENTAYAQGSMGLAKAVAALPDALTIVGGGDTDAVIHKAGLADKFTFISTGGGSFLEFMEGKELPAFTALKECAA